MELIGNPMEGILYSCQEKDGALFSVTLVLFGRMLGVNMDHAGNLFQADREFVRGVLGAC